LIVSNASLEAMRNGVEEEWRLLTERPFVPPGDGRAFTKLNLIRLIGFNLINGDKGVSINKRTLRLPAFPQILYSESLEPLVFGPPESKF